VLFVLSFLPSFGMRSASSSGVPASKLVSYDKRLPFDVVVALPGNPPPNGPEVVQFIQQAFIVLGATDFAFAEFNRHCTVPATTTRMAVLQARLCAAPPPLEEDSSSSSSSSASSFSSFPSSKKSTVHDTTENQEVEQKVGADPSLLTTVKTEPGLVAKAAGPFPVLALTHASYGPVSHLSHMSSVANGVSARAHVTDMPSYLDPTTDAPEDQEWARLRVRCQRLLEAVMVNHTHITAAVRPGDIATFRALISALCVGDETVVVLDHFAAMVDMARAPPRQWTELAKLLNRLQLHLNLTPDHPLVIGRGVLPQHALRALSHFPELAVEVSLLRKIQNGEVTLERIISDISLAVSQQASSSGSTPTGLAGNAAALPAKAPAVPTVGVCFHFRDHGRCKHGDQCKWSHLPRVDSGTAPVKPTSGVCYECGSSAHGVSDCPIAKKRKAKITAKHAKVTAQMSKDMEDAQATFAAEKLEWKAQLAEAKTAQLAIKGSAALRGDPTDVWGIDEDLKSIFGSD
jgi:hypothetical protein